MDTGTKIGIANAALLVVTGVVLYRRSTRNREEITLLDTDLMTDRRDLHRLERQFEQSMLVTDRELTRLRQRLDALEEAGTKE